MCGVLNLVLAGKASCLPEAKALQGNGVTVNPEHTCPLGLLLKGRGTCHPPDVAQSECSLTPAFSQKISAARP